MSEHPAFAGPVGGAAEVSGSGWTLTDESATPRLLVYEAFEPNGEAEPRLGVDFGAATAAGDGSLACGVRPGEWLLLGKRAGSAPEVAGAVTVDLTHGLAMFRLTGPAARDVLAAVCSIDTAETMMPDGAVCGASVARVACILVRDDAAGERAYLILSQRSSGRYLFDAVRDAGVQLPNRRGPSTPARPGTAPPS